MITPILETLKLAKSDIAHDALNRLTDAVECVLMAGESSTNMTTAESEFKKAVGDTIFHRYQIYVDAFFGLWHHQNLSNCFWRGILSGLIKEPFKDEQVVLSWMETEQLWETAVYHANQFEDQHHDYKHVISAYTKTLQAYYEEMHRAAFRMGTEAGRALMERATMEIVGQIIPNH